MRVLVIEDEEVMARSIAVGLRRAGHAVDVDGDGISGLESAAVNRYDVVILDRDLPGVHGDQVCRDLREQDSMTRILMLTASGSVADRVSGLELGADDYLAKPFAFTELRARVAALGRRTAPAHPPTLQVDDLVVDTARRTATRAGLALNLSPKEFGMLEVLITAHGRVVSAEELLERVWDANIDPFTNVVRVTMVGLRRKLGEPGIDTLRGVGYQLALTPSR